MHRSAVQSSMAKSIGYDPLRRVVEVEFVRTGKVAMIKGVSQEQFAATEGADSIGRALQSLLNTHDWEYV